MIYTLYGRVDKHALYVILLKVVQVWKLLISELSLFPSYYAILILMDKMLIAEADEDWRDLCHPISHCLEEDAALTDPIGSKVFCDCTKTCSVMQETVPNSHYYVCSWLFLIEK